MKLGIVGLPNVGKTTLFNALTGSQAETGSYTNAAAKPNIGTAKVTPDEAQGVPHHMVDVAEPSENFSVARYVEMACPQVADLYANLKRRLDSI